MPGQNETGPQGQGPMTGRGMGRCNPANTGMGLGRGVRMGMRRGRDMGGGRGFRFRNWAAAQQDYTAQDRIVELESRITGLQQELNALRQQHENSDQQR